MTDEERIAWMRNVLEQSMPEIIKMYLDDAEDDLDGYEECTEDELFKDFGLYIVAATDLVGLDRRLTEIRRGT